VIPSLVLKNMFRLGAAGLAVAAASNATNSPTCSVNGASGGQVVTVSDGKYQRCFSLITPPSVSTPMPILFWFHGSGGNAAHCGSDPLVELAEEHGFAFICGEATQNVFGQGGQWDIPAEITDQTGTPCGNSDSVEPAYMQAIIDHLDKTQGKYDTKRLFTSGCSMGSAFSGYIANCLKHQDPTQISAFATHSTGLKYKGDGNRLPSNWGECDGCQWWPFAPVKYSDAAGLKACIFDNTGDGDFYQTSVYLAQKWPQLGNPTESHFASGGHCQNIPHSDIVACLGLGGSPAPSPTPVPPAPTPSPTPPTPSPSPVDPPALCQQCFTRGCPQLKGTGAQQCHDCVRQNQGSCAGSCAPFPFSDLDSWFCDAGEVQV
jgi:poly(3-hydroxybutyrate) depolymerase